MVRRAHVAHGRLFPVLCEPGRPAAARAHEQGILASRRARDGPWLAGRCIRSEVPDISRHYIQPVPENEPGRAVQVAKKSRATGLVRNQPEPAAIAPPPTQGREKAGLQEWARQPIFPRLQGQLPGSLHVPRGAAGARHRGARFQWHVRRLHARHSWPATNTST